VARKRPQGLDVPHIRDDGMLEGAREFLRMKKAEPGGLVSVSAITGISLGYLYKLIRGAYSTVAVQPIEKLLRLARAEGKLDPDWLP